MTYVDVDRMVRWAPLPGWSGRIFDSDHMTFAHWDIAADAADLHEHSHPQEEVWNVVDGAIILVVAGVEQVVRCGEAVVVPADATHAAKPMGACRAIVVDHPRRDWPFTVRDREAITGVRR
jgi:mannose-6-phosphate isomerase-like protein (cupin superfamily)